MAEKKKVMRKDTKSSSKPKPTSLGTGMARKAGEASIKRQQQNCSAMGLKYNSKTGRCE